MAQNIATYKIQALIEALKLRMQWNEEDLG